MVNTASTRRRNGLLLGTAALLACLCATAASAYVGESFLQIPGVESGARGAGYKSWIKFEAQYWVTGAQMQSRAVAIHDTKRMKFTGPAAPRQGAGSLALALDKQNPALKPLMDLCARGAPVAEIKFAESADLARPSVWWGKRPATVPAYFEYSLKDVTLSCPVVADAPEQALVLAFKDIKWLNYQGGDQSLATTPVDLAPAQSTGATRTFALKFFGDAVDVSDDQCPVMATSPTADDNYVLLAAAKNAAATANVGATTQGLAGAGTCLRGPDKLSICQLPGLVRDPGNPAPRSKVANGVDLDGDDGHGAPPKDVRKHLNFPSPDGRRGIDNQLFTVKGCIPGLKRNGLLTATRIELMQTGLISMLVQVSGIDDEKNDKNVDVTFLYSKDPLAKSASSRILPKFTFRLTDEPELAQFSKRFRGRIENGVVITDSLDEIQFFEGGQSRAVLRNAKVRLEMLPDGTVKGVVGGYQDWREIFNMIGTQPNFERGMSFRTPGFYQALKRSADGLKNPITGAYDGISMAYDFDGVEAFIPPSQQTKLFAQAGSKGRGTR